MKRHFIRIHFIKYTLLLVTFFQFVYEMKIAIFCFMLFFMNFALYWNIYDPCGRWAHVRRVSARYEKHDWRRSVMYSWSIGLRCGRCVCTVRWLNATSSLIRVPPLCTFCTRMSNVSTSIRKSTCTSMQLGLKLFCLVMGWILVGKYNL